MSPADTARRKWLGLARPVRGSDPLGLLRGPGAAAAALSIYWELPSEDEAFAGFGVAAERLSLRSASALREAEADSVRWLGEEPDVPGPWWGGVAFDPNRPSEARWSDFGSARWILPELAFARRGDRAYVVAFAAEGLAADVPALLAARLDAFEEVLRQAEARPDGCGCDCMGEAPLQGAVSSEWSALVGEALGSIAQGALSKVVVARPVDVRLESPFQPAPVLDALRRRHPRCAIFLFNAPGGSSFLGATPETLLRVVDGRLRTEALAATLPANATLDQATDKEWREHRAVVDAIRVALQDRVTELHVDPETTLLRLARLSHLRTGIEANLSHDASLADVALALHPTPAVAGEPRQGALTFLRAREGFDRGWYAGVVGWMGRGAAHLRVALRSALVREREARLFVGAGIVAGSVAEAEWAETAVKASAILEALGGHDVRA